MNLNKITVIGSSNTDMVIKTDRFPIPGETVIGGTFMMNPGGKGANQAVAAARMGGNVTFISKTGDDIFGKQSVHGYISEGIKTDYIFTDPDHPSGIALITVDSKGENTIVVAPGANATLHPNDISKARDEIESSALLLMQLEIPMNTVEYAAEMASQKGVRVILNPAPAQTLSDNLLKHIYMLISNTTETEMLSGIQVIDRESAKKAADLISEKGVKNVVITMGSQGAFIKHGKQYHLIEALPVTAVDTTAAGDTFCGALCVGLSHGISMLESVRFACKAAAISVTRMGAQASIPYKREINTARSLPVETPSRIRASTISG